MDPSLTSLTLLNRIRTNNKDEHAWREFVERYGSRVYQWCLKRRLQVSDAEDVTQEVLLNLAKRFETFEYDPSQSFRGWLRRVTENAIVDFVRSRKHKDAGKGGSSIIQLLAEEPARTELQACLADAFDLDILDEAKTRVQQRVNEKRWQSWSILADQRKSGKEVAHELGISVGVVYANRNQVQKLIKEEVDLLSETS